MPYNTDNSRKVFTASTELIPGGVNSPVRAFGSVGGSPFIADHGQGAWLFDIDGNRYVDYVMSWGPLILGHAHPSILQAVKNAVDKGTSFGVPTKAELELADLVSERMPWIQKLRLVSSGTEACMTAARIARGATGRKIIVKFDGGYHGHSDMFLVKAGSGLATGSLPASGGVPETVTQTTLSLPYNDLEAVRECFEKYGSEIAGVIVEPVAANMGVIPPQPEFLKLLRDLTKKHGAVLIFDEVITGFRLSPAGAAGYFRIIPDLVCLGKILGGGLPIGGVGGRLSLMDQLAPLGSVYQAGTLSGNPLSTAAGIAMLRNLNNQTVYEYLKHFSEKLTRQMAALFEQAGCNVRINLVEGLFTIFFTDEDVVDFASAGRSDMDKYARFHRAMLDSGVFLPPSGYEAWFVSLSHGEEHLEATLRGVEHFLESEK
ncbi:MAG TPA: glutamate-1-semialdehyde 2,1-aminomutase [candidate division Zixibacteria bacterium]|nr:glutamate-1-semialdehyde 2,1-aminomutase [candidate division Zixibacteria bacterium]